jgi:hypothetical protein
MDALARAVVMVRAGAVLVPNANGSGWHWQGACEKCRRVRDLQWCHIHSQGSTPALRWYPDNAFAACAECHVFGRESWHRDVTGAMKWLREHRGDAAVDALDFLRRTRRKPDHDAWRMWLESEVKRLAPWAWERLFMEGGRG